MTETPGQAFRRVRKQRRDRMDHLAADLRTSTSMINYVERGKRLMPLWWLQVVAPEYAAAIVPIWIAELEELLPESERPREGEHAGPLVRSRNLGRISQDEDGAAVKQKSTPDVSDVWDPQPQPYGCPPLTARLGESPEARAFRRHPIAGHKL